MSIVDAGHQVPEPQPLGRLGQSRERHPSFEAWTCRVGEDRVEVVEDPPGLEDSISSAALKTASISAQVVFCGEVLMAKRMRPRYVPPVKRRADLAYQGSQRMNQMRGPSSGAFALSST